MPRSSFQSLIVLSLVAAAVAVSLHAMPAAARAAEAAVDPDVERNCQWAERAFSDRPEDVPPFSFTYGGRPSAEFLASWKRELTDATIDPSRRVRTLTLTDPQTGLEVRAVATIYTDTPGVDWTLHFTNRGTADALVLEDVRTLDASDPIAATDADVVLHRLNGGPCRVDDWMPFDQPLPSGQEIAMAAVGGRSSNVCPFFNIACGAEGVITAIGWSGQWAARVSRQEEGKLRVQAGIERVHLTLHPGESIRAARVLQIRWAGMDHLQSYNLFRRTMLAHVLPRIDGRLVTPPVTTPSPWIVREGNPWDYLYGFKESDALAEIERIKGLGYEFYWTDAYYTRGNFPAGMGNYGLPLDEVVPDLARFPRGLRPISDAAHAAGMKYVVWFEPERVVRGTTIATEHPEFCIWREGDGSGLYNLGLPEARRHMTTILNTAIAQWRMDCLRIDFNIDPLPFWQVLDAEDPNRAGMAEIRYVEGLYQMWDDILKANPHLFIDNCASGGRRVDLEMCSRSIVLWRTDATIDPFIRSDFNQTALQNQVMTAGLNRYVPHSVVGNIGAEPYHFRSGFNYGIVLAHQPLDAERDLLKKAIAEGKRLRKYFLGDFYPLSPVTVSPTDWCVMQYHRPAERDGMIVAFRRHESPDAVFAPKEIRGIDEAADYRVTRSYTYEPSETIVMKGSALKKLEITIGDRPESVIIEYQKTD
ncbi:MAG: alpha-galactosidase [Pirellulales bacterium]|nr:alpha-galactosidase [Pirellulales bacterium]